MKQSLISGDFYTDDNRQKIESIQTTVDSDDFLSMSINVAPSIVKYADRNNDKETLSELYSQVAEILTGDQTTFMEEHNSYRFIVFLDKDRLPQIFNLMTSERSPSSLRTQIENVFKDYPPKTPTAP